MYIYEFLLENYFVIISLIILFIVPRYNTVFWRLSYSHQDISNHKIRSNNIDAIKGIAIISVIIIHACYLLLSKYNNGYESIILTFINNIFRFAIPVFLFSSGFLLKAFVWRSKNIFNFYTDKVLRIGIPYILVNIALWQIGYNNSSPLNHLLFTGEMAVPFYFVPVLFQLYLLYPLLDYFRRLNPKYLLLISLIISIISFLLPITWNINGFPLFTQYLVFFVYGMVRQDALKQKSVKTWIELLLIYFILQIGMASIIGSIISDNNIWEYIYFYNFQIILGFSFIFTSLFYLESKNIGYKVIQNIFAPLGRLSLWIFLLHFPIQQFIFSIFLNSNTIVLVELIQNIILTSIITIPLAYILNRIYSIPRLSKL
jgi:peptidoglycan/LPS O-acetylase OafA/YrhL